MPTSYKVLEQEGLVQQQSLRQKLDRLCGSWVSRLVMFSVLVILIFSVLLAMFDTTTAAKQGAGLLFVSDKQVLLLLRSSRHNDSTWDLPGGNIEPEDTDSLAAAKREASEELGPLPSFEVLTEILTRRGKGQQKLYTIYVCNLNSPQSEFEPKLNREHSKYQWFSVSEVDSLPNLHPIVSILFRDPARKKLAAAISKVAMSPMSDNVEKLGAGLWLMSGKEVLLLTRSSKHNNGSLSVPGGNVDLSDTHLLSTAKREAEEEMGSCPDFEYKTDIDTKRGTQDSKVFKLFLGAVDLEVRRVFKPVLSHESSDWGWYDLDELLKFEKNLHPVVEILLKKHLKELKQAFGF